MAADIQHFLDLAWQRLREEKMSTAAELFRLVVAPHYGWASPEQVASALVGIGTIARARGEPDKSLAYAKEALRHHARHAPAQHLLGQLALDRDDSTVAAVWFREAEALDGR